MLTLLQDPNEVGFLLGHMSGPSSVLHSDIDIAEMSDEGYTDEALLHDGDESAGAIADVDGDNNGADADAGGAANTSGGDDPELEAIKARVKQGG